MLSVIVLVNTQSFYWVYDEIPCLICDFQVFASFQCFLRVFFIICCVLQNVFFFLYRFESDSETKISLDARMPKCVVEPSSLWSTVYINNFIIGITNIRFERWTSTKWRTFSFSNLHVEHKHLHDWRFLFIFCLCHLSFLEINCSCTSNNGNNECSRYMKDQNIMWHVIIIIEMDWRHLHFARHNNNLVIQIYSIKFAHIYHSAFTFYNYWSLI